MRFKQGDLDMTTGPIWKELLQFSIPMAIGLLFQQLYNTVDAIVVGQFVGKEALAAVGGTSSIINMLVGTFAGLATGASVVISQCYGAHDNNALRSAVHTTILATFFLSILATAIGVCITNPMLRLMDIPDDVFASASEYLTIYFAGISGLLIYNMGSGVLRAVGDSRRPLYFLCFSALTNIVLDLLFVIRFHWGIAGVAYATIISQFASAALVLYALTKTDAAYGIRWKQLSIQREMLGRVLSIGLPAGVQQAVTAFSNVFVQSYINFFGSACMAGWASYSKLDAFLLVPIQSIALGSTTFVGQNYGANQLPRARDGMRQALTMSIAITAVLSVLLILCDTFMLGLFTTDPEVVAFGERFITLCCPFYVLLCVNQILGGAMRGIGKARDTMIIMVCSFVVFRQIYLFVTKQLGVGFLAVALAYPMGWVVCSVSMLVLYKCSSLGRAEKLAPTLSEETD